MKKRKPSKVVIYQVKVTGAFDEGIEYDDKPFGYPDFNAVGDTIREAVLGNLGAPGDKVTVKRVKEGK